MSEQDLSVEVHGDLIVVTHPAAQFTTIGRFEKPRLRGLDLIHSPVHGGGDSR
jgi:hypothetical protein